MSKNFSSSYFKTEILKPEKLNKINMNSKN